MNQQPIPQTKPSKTSRTQISFATSSAVRIGRLAFALSNCDLPTAVFAHPRIETANFVTWLRPGEVIQVIDGPAYHRFMPFWYVKSLHRNIAGWSSEGNAQARFIAPIPTRKLCDGILPTRLQIGYSVRVVDPKLRPISLLDAPIPLAAGGRPLDT